ncbi:MAG: hypothetical protein JWQ88_2394 [Rhodoferax sp.]|nr:hypothetical protein [Rhodoferax sp.]
MHSCTATPFQPRSAAPLLAILLTCSGAAVQAQSPMPANAASNTWFTVLGDPDNASVNTVQVDPVDRDNDPRTMRVRVSRSEARSSWDGVPYRSYTSNVFFDCERGSARYLNVTYYAQANWQGEPGKTVDYTTGPVRNMAFKDVTPNPTQRIVHAACSLVSKR